MTEFAFEIIIGNRYIRYEFDEKHRVIEVNQMYIDQ